MQSLIPRVDAKRRNLLEIVEGGVHYLLPRFVKMLLHSPSRRFGKAFTVHWNVVDDWYDLLLRLLVQF
jgi:hypothetical protein